MKRKAIAVVLGFCLTMNLGMPAYAAEGNGDTDTAQIKEAVSKAIVADTAQDTTDVTSGEEPEPPAPPAPPVPGWKTENGQQYYVRQDGTYETGYKRIDGKYYYFDADGAMQTGLQKINGSLYWFDQAGKAMGKGWVSCHDGNKRYGTGNGKLSTGYKKIGKDYYFLNQKNGAMTKGVAVIKGKPYFFKDNGKAAGKGWIKANGGAKKYYSLGKGKLKTGWTSIKSYGYYFYPKNGEMAKKTKVKGIKIGASGKLGKAYGRAITTLDKNGWNLRAAFNYSSHLRYYRPLPRNGKPGSAWFANYGFTKGKGNCYVMASTFYYMAKVLGYDVHQMSGYVWANPHSWCIVKQKGKTYVYDPNFTNETGRNGYKIYYGKPGTWRYTRSRSYRMN